jgi:hypothetical protein
MVQIVTQSSLNISGLSADDAYIVIVPPPNFIQGVPTDVFGIVGTASWGPVNQPVSLGGPQDAVTSFGGISAASVVDEFDLATDLYLAFGQASSQASIQGWAVRVTDGTDTAAFANLTGATSAGETITIAGTVAANDTASVTITDASIVGSPFTFTFKTGTTDTVTTVAAALASQINRSAPLVAAGFSATSAAGVVTIDYPSTATATFTATGSGELTAVAAAGSGSTAGATVTALYTGVLGNQVIVTIMQGQGTNMFNVTVQPFQGSTELFPNIPGTGFWANLANAVNNGITSVRGPSQIIRITAFNSGVGVPASLPQATTLTGGTDGRSGVTTADLLGSSSATPATGLFALSGLNPAVGVAWIVGSTDTILPEELVAFGQTAGCSTLWAFPTGTSTSSAVSELASLGVADPSFWPQKDFIYFFDQANNMVRLVPPTAVVGGLWTSLAPQVSPGNEPVKLVLGTERNYPLTGLLQPYSEPEIGQLASAGIGFITNPIPAGAIWGTRHGESSSLQQATKPAEYWRMTTFIARSLAEVAGDYVNALQSQQPNDPLRNSLKLELNQFLQTLEDNSQIDSYSVICSFSASASAQAGNGINTPISVAQRYLYAMCLVTYLASVRFFILSLQGGTTVVTVASGGGAALPNS